MLKTNLYPEQRPFNLMVREGEDAGAQTKVADEAEINRRIEEAVAAQVAGLKNKNQELLGTLAKQKETLAQFEGLDPTALKSLKERLDADEDTKLFSEGKKEMVIEKYTQRMRDQHKAELAAFEARVADEAKRADAYKGAVLDNQILSAANGQLHKSAIEDALLLGRTIFSLDAKGKAVRLDSEGRPELGKDGSNPFSPAEWIETMKELKPHWFPASTTGSGSGNAREGGSGAGKTITRSKFEGLSAADQAKTARSGVKIVD